MPRKSCIYLLMVVTLLLFLPLVGVALGQEKTPAPAGAADTGGKTALALASGLTIAIAAFGGAWSQGRTVAAAMEGIARNPGAQEKMFIPLVLGLVFIESLVIYALVIAFFLQGKI